MKQQLAVNLMWRQATVTSTTPSPGVPRVHIRDAAETDMGAVQGIYAHHVLRGLASFEETPPSLYELLRRRISVLAAQLPYLIAERDGEVVGYSYATEYHSRSGYRHTIEDSVYVAAGLGGQGIGGTLLQALIARCETGPWRQMIAYIGNSANTASIALHRRMGFQMVGTLSSVGFKLGQWADVVLMQRPLGVGDRSMPTGHR
jgi:L-amino acid N-acyltransferase YncA